ncbi:MAG: hypothetical protein WAN36_13415 [Calditrichia bacterium]
MIIVTGLTLIITLALFRSNAGYRAVTDVFIKRNLDFIRQQPGLTYDQKMAAKFPKDYPFVMYVKEATPDSAVILMPPRSVKSMLNATNGAQNKWWSEYFLYPRRLVYADDAGNPLLDSLTHILIINNWGYDYLLEHYQTSYTNKAPYAVLKIPDRKQ